MKDSLTKLSYDILKVANSELPRSIFLKEVTYILLDWLKCSDLKVLFRVPKSDNQYELITCSKDSFDYKIIQLENLLQSLPEEESVGLWQEILDNKFDSSSTFFTDNGTFWTINFATLSVPYKSKLGSSIQDNLTPSKRNYSLLIVPFLYSKDRIGLMQFKDIKQEVFSSLGTKALEEFAQALSAILINQHTQALLLERVKELAFLYEMLNITKDKTASLDDVIHQIIKLVPSAWQYPNITKARIVLNGKEYTNTSDFKEEHSLKSDIVVNDNKCGTIEVIYTEKCPDIDLGPFFNEEKSLLNNIALEIATFISQQ